MSMRCTLTYWQWGPFAFHRYRHAAQPWREKARAFYDIGIWRYSWQVWPWTMTYEKNPWWSAPR